MKKVFITLSILLITIFISINRVYALEVNYNEVYVGINSQVTLQAYNGMSSQIVWKSSNSNVATVYHGVVTGKSLGNAYISISDGTHIISSKVYVIDDYVPVSSLKLESNETTMSIGATKKTPITINPSNASNQKLQYRSSNSNIASVDSSGNIKAISEGSAYISVTGESKAVSYKVNVVNKITLTDISTPTKLELVEGETQRIVVTYKPSNATNKGVTWKSSNTAVVTVDSNGSVKAIASGNATITATSSEGNHKAITTITVNAIDKTLKGISLNKNKTTLDVGKEETLTVTFDPANADNKKVTWESSNSRIVSVEDGKITAIKPGKAEITVYSADKQHEAKCEVTVPSPPIESIKFAQEKKTMYVGTTEMLEIITTPTDAIIEEPIWSSSDVEVAVVTEAGEVNAIKVGTTMITVSDKSGEITASIEINVIEKPPEKLMIKVEGYDLNFNPDQKDYTLSIGNETKLNITANVDASKLIIGGNQDLKNGSVITVTINNKPKVTYVINIKKKANLTLYFIGIITILLIINLIRIAISNKRKKQNPF